MGPTEEQRVQAVPHEVIYCKIKPTMMLAGHLETRFRARKITIIMQLYHDPVKISKVQCFI